MHHVPRDRLLRYLRVVKPALLILINNKTPTCQFIINIQTLFYTYVAKMACLN